MSTPPSHRRRHRPAGIAMVLLSLAAAAPAWAQRAALTQNVDEPGRNPFAVALSGTPPNAYFASFVVPAGKRYVIDNYTATCDVQAGHALTTVTLSGITTGVASYLTTTAHYFQPDGSNGGVAVNAYTGSSQGPLYADPGSRVYIEGRDDNFGSSVKSCSFNIAGHVIVLN